MHLILTDAAPIPWFVAGAAIAAVTLVLLYAGNRRLGVSTGFENVCSLVVRTPYFTRAAISGSNSWRLPLLAGGWETTWALGRFDSEFGWGNGAKLAWMFGGGLLIGFGTRLAGGCTSGHGIFGLSNLELPSLISTVSFMAAGVVTTNLIYRVIL